MKIFNWVHRRFNSRAAENGKQNVGIGGEDENKLGNGLDCWRGGILTIGTFGFDPLKDEISCDDQINYDHEDKEELGMEVEGDDVDYNDDSEEEEDEGEEEKPNLVYEEEEEERWELGYEYVMMEKKARTTLADLFMHAHCHEDTTTFNQLKCKHDHSSNNNKKKKKKHLLLDQLRPIHKLNKLMRRMLKRKIHPADIGAENPKVAVLRKCDINDHASLLIPTPQDVII